MNETPIIRTFWLNLMVAEATRICFLNPCSQPLIYAISQ